MKKNNQALVLLGSALTAFVAEARILEEVVVTAQKKSESINDVPLSIQAFSGDTLKQLGITDTRDLQAVVPGFTYSDSGVNTPVYTLRGVGFNDTTYNATPTVGVYVDEISLPYSIMTKGPSTDLERIEVLKGPQGLLYGRNSTGGAINFITNKPGDELEAGISTTYSRFNTLDIESYIGGPLTDRVGARLAVRSVRSNEGYQKSRTRPGDTLGEVDKLSWRGILQWETTDSLRFDFTTAGWTDESDASAAQAMFFEPVQAAPGQPSHPRVTGYPYIDEDSDDNRVADWDPTQDWQNNDEFWYGALRMEWDINESMGLTVLANHGQMESDGTKIPQSGIDVLNAEIDIVASIDFSALEFRLDGTAFEETLQWMVGGNVAEDETEIDYTVLLDTATANAPFGPPTENSPYGVGLLGNRVGLMLDGDSSTAGVFANVDWDFAENFKLHVGARYTEDERRSSACTFERPESEHTVGFNAVTDSVSQQQRLQNGLLPSPTPTVQGDCATLAVNQGFITEREADRGNGTPEPIYNETLSEDNVAFKVGVDWLPAFGLVYASFIRGYKSGSFPLLSSSTTAAFEPATQERLDAVEIGSKLSFLDGNLQSNAAVFYYEYTDKQLLVRTPDPLFGPLPVLRNAPESVVNGAELSVSWQASEALYLSLAGSYIDTEVKEFTGAGFVSGEEIDFAGQQFNFSPRVQANALINYSWLLGDNLTLAVGGSWSYTGTSNSTLEGDERFEHPAYDVLGANVALGDTEDRWRVTAFGRNLTDELGIISLFKTGDVAVRRVIAPVTYGLTFSYNYF